MRTDETPADTATTLHHHAVVAFTGADAERFLHAQLANDVASLAVGDWQWNCGLTPQGRVVALCVLMRVAPGELVAVLPADAAAPWLADLRRYVLRSKVRLDIDVSREAAASFGVAPTALVATGTLVRDGVSVIARIGGAADRALVVRPRGDPTADDGGATALRWRAADIADEIPRVAGPVAGEYTPHALALQRLAAFSVKKGCYPGQEIVARTHFLGRNKRRPARFTATRPPPPGARLVADGASEAQADVIDAIATPDGARGLAILRGEPAGPLHWRDDDGALVAVALAPPPPGD